MAKKTKPPVAGNSGSGAMEPPLPPPVCEDDPYPRYSPGVRQARCVGYEEYIDPRYRARKCRLDYALLPDGEAIAGFFHMGNEREAKVRRGSKYRRAWIIANGEQPKKRQIMSPKTFVDKIFEVEVGDVKRRGDGLDHPEVEVYSTVQQIKRRMWP